MSLTIIKPGILDTIQDKGRFGFQQLGINPGGAMDLFSAQMGNALLGKELNQPVIEMHFPAATIRFNETTIIALTGADFSPCIFGKELPMNQPILISKGMELQFTRLKRGARCYLSLLNNFQIPGWLGSYSTNVKAGAGGFEGRAFSKGNTLPYENLKALEKGLAGKDFRVLPWYAYPPHAKNAGIIEVMRGPEWDRLDEQGHKDFLGSHFYLSTTADRMGFMLQGPPLATRVGDPIVSSAVSFGTIQLLPSGQLIILMADHQTTGGYPRVANVISAHLPSLAQSKPGDTFSFRFVSLDEAEEKLWEQYHYLQQVQMASADNIEKFLS